MIRNNVEAFLADLGERVAAHGITAGCGDLLLVAGAARPVTPAAADVLIDPDQPAVARHRALAVISAVVVRNATANRLMRHALIDDVVPGDSYLTAA
jgi:hypothetical protein